MGYPSKMKRNICKTFYVDLFILCKMQESIFIKKMHKNLFCEIFQKVVLDEEYCTHVFKTCLEMQVREVFSRNPILCRPVIRYKGT